MSDSWGELPLLTPDLPGTGGIARAGPEDFQVEELPAYEPCGEGDHLFLWVEKRGRNTRDLVRELARQLGIRDGDIGVAGQKDRQALTRQWLSVPRRSAGATAGSGLSGEGWTVLEARPHRNKLKTGHLRGNRFAIRLRGCVPGALERARAVAEAMARRGMPNAYGPQRFGRDGTNAALGRSLVLREERPEARRAARDRFTKRMVISAYQALLFNRVLGERMREGLFERAVAGDLMKKLETGGLFVSEDLATDGPRLERFEISATGPIFGHRMMEPRGEAQAREARVLAAEALTPESFAHLGDDAQGSRRPMRLPLKLEVEAQDDGLLLRFELEKGSFATVVLREVMKPGAAEELPELGEA